MPFDIAELDADIRRLTMIRELAKDPKSRAVMERYLRPNGNGDGNKPHADEHSPESPVPAKRKYGEMAKYAEQVLTSVPQTPEQIAEQMIALGFVFQGKAPPKYMVGDALRSMEEKGKAKRAEEKGPYKATLWTK